MSLSKVNINKILEDYQYKIENLLPILLEVQDISEGKFITPDTASYVSDAINIPYSQMSEVLSFFAAINKEAKGKYHIEMCNSTVCRVNDNQLIEAFLRKHLDISIGETTDDKMFSLDYAPCFGACDISPSIRINKKAYGHLTVEKVEKILSNLRGE